MDNISKEEFSKLVQEKFHFLPELGLKYHNTWITGRSSSREYEVISRYESSLRADIGWSPSSLSLSILLKYNDIAVSNLMKYVYFEPFIEFSSAGVQLPVVPYITEKMNISTIEAVLRRRAALFEAGLPVVMDKLAYRFLEYLPRLRVVSAKEICEYHQWMAARR